MQFRIGDFWTRDNLLFKPPIPFILCRYQSRSCKEQSEEKSHELTSDGGRIHGGAMLMCTFDVRAVDHRHSGRGQDARNLTLFRVPKSKTVGINHEDRDCRSTAISIGLAKDGIFPPSHSTMKLPGLTMVATLHLFLMSVLAESLPQSPATIRNNSPSLPDSPPGPTAHIIGESALVDKETGRIFWKGGSTTTLSASLTPVLDELGVRHVRATALSGLLLLAIVSNLLAWLRRELEASSWKSTDSWVIKSLFFFLNWTLLRIPKLGSRFVAAVCLLSLLEAHTCSTRRYLANAMSSREELEEYIERLRAEPPVVTWKVRCFHYERRQWLSVLLLASLWRRIFRRQPSDEMHLSLMNGGRRSASLLTRKVVTHEATGNYTFNSFQDDTVVGVWKRAESTRITPAPFTKIMLSKLLVLSNAKAREDYFKQQSGFVTMEGQADEYAEFSTNIDVHGFKRRMLAVRPVEGHPSAKIFRLNLFWLLTFLGLTVPFRVWFARHCDELRVTVAKETSTVKTSSSSWFRWSTSTKAEDTTVEGFRRVMRDLALYTKLEEPRVGVTNETQELLEDIEVAAASAIKMNVLNGTLSNTTQAVVTSNNTTQVPPHESSSEVASGSTASSYETKHFNNETTPAALQDHEAMDDKP